MSVIGIVLVSRLLSKGLGRDAHSDMHFFTDKAGLQGMTAVAQYVQSVVISYQLLRKIRVVGDR